MNEFLTEHKVLIRKSLGALFVLLLLGAVFLATMSISALKKYSYIGRDMPAYNTITVNGTGEAFQAPDTAVFSFTVTREGANVAEAQTAVSTRISEVLEGLSVFNIEERDIKTTGYYANPRYEYPQVVCLAIGCPTPGERVLTGYEVSQTISVKVRDLTKLAEVVQKLGELNVDNLFGPDLTIDDEDALIASARAEAIADAEEKARDIAEALGVKLVRVVGFYETSPYAYGYGGDMVRSEAMLDAGAPKVEIPTGENQFTSEVSITYEVR